MEMRVEIHEEPVTTLAEYASVPIAFEVNWILELTVCNNGLDGFTLTKRRLDAPYIKDYDASKGESPVHWAKRFDVSNWGLLVARIEGQRVGGAVIAFNTDGLAMLEGRDDLAVLWDIRVTPEARGQGVGAALFRAAEAWAKTQGCRQLKIETQNINLPACRFYARQGCVLGAINRFAYPELPDEVQLFWYKELA